jgi:hypothetical protein
VGFAPLYPPYIGLLFSIMTKALALARTPKAEANDDMLP